jgi:hypothetical protein
MHQARSRTDWQGGTLLTFEIRHRVAVGWIELLAPFFMRAYLIR